HEFSGLGPDTEGPPIGTRVIAAMERGAFAERALATAAVLAPVPEHVSSLDAAGLGLAAQTAWFALTVRARIEAGESVLVLGASGAVGLAAVAIARALGAARVIGAVRTDTGAQLAREAGAHAVLRLDRPAVRDTLRDELSACGGPVDLVVDPIGGDATSAALRCLAWSGRLVIVGFAAGDIPHIRANYLLLKNIAVLGLQWSDYRERTPERVVSAWRFLFRLYESGALAPRIGRVLPLAQTSEALVGLAAGGGGERTLLRIME
uniref:zinc-binding dehydrogenase n=1 Tax=Roseococcus thiosulfatophilus TaxID=35813 RepID=UPI001A8F5323